jgi:hypothetical protein
MSRWTVLLAVLAGTLAVFPTVRAEEGGGAGDRPDRAQMRERMMNAVKEQLGASEDEWKALQPKVEKVMTAQRDMGGRFGGFSGRGRGEGGDQPQSKVSQAQRELRTALENRSAPAEEIAKKLAALREAREQARTQLQAAQKELKAAVNPRQEAALVLAGMLE